MHKIQSIQFTYESGEVQTLSVNGTHGTISVTAGNTAVNGVNTAFNSQLKVGSTITSNGETRTITSIVSDTSLVTDAWKNSAINVPYTFVR